MVSRSRRLKATCKYCGGDTIICSNHIYPVVAILASVGLDVSYADAHAFNVTLTDDDEPDLPHKGLTMWVGFGRIYDADIFVVPPLPDGFHYVEVRDLGISRILYHEFFFTFGKLSPTQAVKAVTNKLHEWAINYAASDLHYVHRLSGLID